MAPGNVADSVAPLTHTYRGRIAPSPTGLLHLGHARTFLIAAERAEGGVLLLRDDDLDTDRVRPHFVTAMVHDLDWLGIRWAPADGDVDGMWRQSQHRPLYDSIIARLAQRGWLYSCNCSRKDLATAARAPHAEEEEEPLYPGTCRGRLCDAPGALRFRVPRGETVAFVDGAAGPQQFTAGVDFGDFVVRRRDEVPSYQLACAADDFAMRITEVVRGRDLLHSTARQILIQRAMGWPTPAYYHCGLIVDAAGHRLAKRSDALSVQALREQGLSAEAVRQMAMAATVQGAC